MALNQDLIKGICQTHIQDMSLIKGHLGVAGDNSRSESGGTS
jgi:hypothetical protein